MAAIFQVFSKPSLPLPFDILNAFLISALWTPHNPDTAEEPYILRLPTTPSLHAFPTKRISLSSEKDRFCIEIEHFSKICE